MHQGKYVFSQIMESIVRYQFNQCVARYHGEYRVKHFTCWEQFLAMAFGQLSYRESLSDVVICLNAQREKLYHFGFRSSVVLSTLTRANERRDWRIWRDLAQLLIGQARTLYADDTPFSLDLEGTVYALDSTTIELCLSLFPWATSVATKGAAKLHMVIDLRGNIPTFFDISKGNVNDVNFLDAIAYDPSAFYIMDRGYHDYARWHAIHQAGAFFVTRAKRTMVYKRLHSNAVDKSTGIRCDQVIRLSGVNAAKRYPGKLRRIKYFDAEHQKYYVFLTNNVTISARTTADLYKQRWQIELFFKWIKQHLKIRAFWGHSQNAVKTQICIAICSYLVVAILKKRLGINRNLYEILQILSVSQFDKTPISTLVSEAPLQSFEEQPSKQASLWDY